MSVLALEKFSITVPLVHKETKLLRVTEVEGNITIVRFPKGNLITGTQAIAVSDQLADLVHIEKRSRLIFSFATVQTISIAIAELIGLHAQTIKEHGGQVKACCLDFVISEIFLVTKFNALIPIFPDEESARKAF